MSVHPLKEVSVELYGISRQRAGVAATTASGHCLGDVLQELSSQLPGLADAVIDGRQLRPGYMVSLNGQRFVTDPETLLSAGDVVLLLSMDAGG